MTEAAIKVEVVPRKRMDPELTAADFWRIVDPVMVQGGKGMEGMAIKGVTAGGYSGLRTRSKNLKESINSHYDRSTHTLYFGAGFGPSAAYAAAHEYGRPWVLRPVRKKFLLVPLKPYLTEAGAAAQEDVRVWQNYDFDFFPIGTGGAKKKRRQGTYETRHQTAPSGVPRGPSKANNNRNYNVRGYVAVEQRSQVPWFLLLKEVGPLKKRPYLAPAVNHWAPRMAKRISRLLNQELDRHG